jgi:hypothetical protein
MRINWLGVLISVVLAVVLRHAWYAHFGGTEWGGLASQVINEIRGDTTLAGKELLNALVMVLALGWLIDATRSGNIGGGLGVGLAAGIGFAVTSVSSGYLHGGPLMTLLIDGGYLLAAYVLTGLILGAMAPRRRSQAKFNWSSGEASNGGH